MEENVGKVSVYVCDEYEEYYSYVCVSTKICDEKRMVAKMSVVVCLSCASWFVAIY